MANGLTSIHGRRLMVAATGQLTSNGIDISRPCVNATIAIGAEGTNTRTITIQLLDANGDDINYVETFELIVFTSTAMTAFGTGGTTAIAVGTDGALLALVASKVFLCTSESDGDWDGVWTDTGTETAVLGVRLPNGRVVVSASFANT